MLEQFAPLREQISLELARWLNEKRGELGRVNPLGPDACDRLLDFCRQGKMIRGCLVTTGCSLGASRDRGAPASCIAAGAAMELFQAGLLIHDDVMDRDLTRRGRPTIFSQYAADAEAKGLRDPYHLGESLGTCVGDIAYFLAFELLARLDGEAEVRSRLIGLCAQELTLVGAAQMQDVAWGPSAAPAGREEILRLYAYKTGRYTFSLPLMAGGILAGAAPGILARFSEIGEHLGVLFQIRDDELNLFGDERETGKPVGSDIREGKKTLLAALLGDMAGPAESGRLSGILGSGTLAPDDLAYVRRLAEASGARKAARAAAAQAASAARSLVSGLHAAQGEGKQQLQGILDYCMTRTR
jgi:geranylgeranyl diphosphate synthase, type I